MSEFKVAARDKVYAAVCLCFVMFGLLMLPAQPIAGCIVMGIFGLCGAGVISGIRRKRQDSMLLETAFVWSGPTVLRPSRLKTFPAWTVLFVTCAAWIHLEIAHNVITWSCSWIGAACGAAGMLATLTGYFPKHYIEFRPDGLRVAYWGWSVLIPWNQISDVTERRISNGSVVCLRFLAPDSFEVSPPSRKSAFAKRIKNSRAWGPIDLAFNTFLFSVSPTFLRVAIEHFRRHQSARMQLINQQ